MLLVDQQFRIADDVDEKDMRDLELNFFLTSVDIARSYAKTKQLIILALLADRRKQSRGLRNSSWNRKICLTRILISDI